jgi:hypothetical protein
MPLKIDTLQNSSGLIDSSQTANYELFNNHLLLPQGSKPVLHFTNYDFVVAGILFFLYILFVWLYVSNRKRLNQIIKGFYINRYANQLAREELAIGYRVSLFLAMLFVFSLSIFFVQLNNYFVFFVINNSISYLIVSAAIIVLYFCKFIFIKILAFIFKLGKEEKEYKMGILLFCNALGIFMFPIVICLQFVNRVEPLVFIYSGLSVVSLFLVIRLIRSFAIGLNSNRVSLFYLFLYICTFEILPFMIGAKLFILNCK